MITFLNVAMFVVPAVFSIVIHNCLRRGERYSEYETNPF